MVFIRTYFVTVSLRSVHNVQWKRGRISSEVATKYQCVARQEARLSGAGYRVLSKVEVLSDEALAVHVDMRIQKRTVTYHNIRKDRIFVVKGFTG